jgi:hypothetical protein
VVSLGYAYKPLVVDLCFRGMLVGGPSGLIITTTYKRYLNCVIVHHVVSIKHLDHVIICILFCTILGYYYIKYL